MFSNNKFSGYSPYAMDVETLSRRAAAASASASSSFPLPLPTQQPVVDRENYCSWSPALSPGATGALGCGAYNDYNCNCNAPRAPATPPPTSQLVAGPPPAHCGGGGSIASVLEALLSSQEKMHRLISQQHNETLAFMQLQERKFDAQKTRVDLLETRLEHLERTTQTNTSAPAPFVRATERSRSPPRARPRRAEAATEKQKLKRLGGFHLLSSERVEQLRRVAMARLARNKKHMYRRALGVLC